MALGSEARAVYARRTVQRVNHKPAVVAQRGVGRAYLKHLFGFFQRVFFKCFSVLNNVDNYSGFLEGEYLLKTAGKYLLYLAHLMGIVRGYYKLHFAFSPLCKLFYIS